MPSDPSHLQGAAAPLDRPAPAAGRARRSSAPDKILRATEALLLEGGVDGISIRKLSDRCGYSAPTIYHHFGDKQGLLDALLEARFRELLERMRARPRGADPARHLREMADEFVGFVLEFPSHYQLLMVPREREQPVPSLEAAQALVEEDLAELRRRGWLATRDLDAAFDVLWAVLHGVITLQLGLRTGEAAADMKELALDMVESGLLMREGPKG